MERDRQTLQGSWAHKATLDCHVTQRDNYTVVKCVGPGVANLSLDLKATTYQLYDPIQTTELPPNVSFPVCKWDNHHSTVSQTPGVKIRGIIHSPHSQEG